MGAASRVWLHHALDSLNKSQNGKLVILSGRAEEILPELMAASDIASIHWNRCYEPWRMARDSKIKDSLAGSGPQGQVARRIAPLGANGNSQAGRHPLQGFYSLLPPRLSDCPAAAAPCPPRR